MNQAAQTILAQIGGGRFIAMTGARDILADNMSIQFKLPAGFAAKRINFVRITLTAADLYNIVFSQWKPRSLELVEVETVEGVFADKLREVFTAATGLETRI